MLFRCWIQCLSF